MAIDKRYSCESVPSWHEGVFFRLISTGRGGCKLVVCDNTGATLPAGNVLSVTSDGVLQCHSGVQAPEGIIRVNPHTSKIYLEEDYVNELREQDATAQRSTVEVRQRRVSWPGGERVPFVDFQRSVLSQWLSLEPEAPEEQEEVEDD